MLLRTPTSGVEVWVPMWVEAYRHYRRACKSVPFQDSYMPYRWGGLPQRLHVRWMAYNEFFNTFASELANAINQLTNTVHRLQCWAVALPQLSDRLRVEALLEFVDPHAKVALSLPYAIRSRFVFATAHLCHQANQAKLGQALQRKVRGTTIASGISETSLLCTGSPCRVVVS